MANTAYLEQQYQDINQQTQSATLGMWVFLATEILFFGVLFTSYTIYRVRWPDAFRHGSQDLKLWIGGINTAVLLTSSLFMALAVRAAAMGNNRFVMIHLGITIAAGVAFLGFKATEYVLEARGISCRASISRRSRPTRPPSPPPSSIPARPRSDCSCSSTSS